MIKKIRDAFRSLKVISFVTNVFCFVCAWAIMIFAAVSIEKNTLLEQKSNEIGNYCWELSKKIIASGYLANSSENAGITQEIGIIADKYDARIIVIDSSLRCIYDTYSIEKDKTFISTYVIKALKNSMDEYRNDENETVDLYYPIDSGDDDGSSDGVILFSYSISSVYDTSDRLGKTLMLIAFPCTVVIVFMAISHSRYISKPMRRITTSINQISDGYRDTGLEMRTFNEFEEMTDALNNMVKRLNSIENSRQEFVSNVSHELKTPLTSIKILADSLLMQPDAAPEVYREFLGDITSEIDRENRIITDLLELVKLDRENGEMHIAVVSVNELLDILMKRMKPIAQAHNVDFVVETYRKVDAEIDEVKMMLAITNLIENAIKYNKDAGSVRVTLDSDHKVFTLTVSDTGIGIPEESKDMIFDRFYRVDKMRARKTGGTGLGLSITKSVVLMHNGQIKVDSREGEGTVFTMKIPLSFVEKQEE